MQLSQAIEALQQFYGNDLTRTLGQIEVSIQGANRDACTQLLTTGGTNLNTLAAAGLVKHVAAQINVAIHALGILLCLPHVLEDKEIVGYVSLGAGNTGRAFDLETNRRIAEFKFIRWQGGPESIRQNSIFKDFYCLAEYPTKKRKYLYLLDTEHPRRFFNGGRALSSVLSRNRKLQDDFHRRFGEKYRTVRDYYAVRKDKVILQDISQWVPGLVEVAVDGESEV